MRSEAPAAVLQCYIPICLRAAKDVVLVLVLVLVLDSPAFDYEDDDEDDDDLVAVSPRWTLVVLPPNGPLRIIMV